MRRPPLFSLEFGLMLGLFYGSIMIDYVTLKVRRLKQKISPKEKKDSNMEIRNAHSSSQLTSEYTHSEDVTIALLHSKAKNTWESYQRDWNIFSEWCKQRNLDPFQTNHDNICEFLVDQAKEFKKSTIMRRVASINSIYQQYELDSPAKHKKVYQVLAGIRRQKAGDKTEKSAIQIHNIRQAIPALRIDTLKGKRDKAMLLIGYCGALRASEIASIRVEDITFTHEGITLKIPKSKSDQEGRGIFKGIPYAKRTDCCAVLALMDYIKHANIVSGYIFKHIDKGENLGPNKLTTKSIYMIIKGLHSALGLEEKDICAHSLRSGLITDAINANIHMATIKRHTGHQSLIVLESYYRRAGIFNENVLKMIGI